MTRSGGLERVRVWVAVAGVGFARLAAVAFLVLLLVFVVGKVVAQTEWGKRDDCLDRGGMWLSEKGECLRPRH